MTALLLLIATLLPLLFAPRLARRAGRSPMALAGLDAFVAVTVGAVTLTHVLPHSLEAAGGLALVAAALGFAVPVVLHYGMHRLERKAMPGLIALVLLGLAVHAIGDGIALVGAGVGARTGAASQVPLLALAVVLHRLPVAMATWWFARPAFGRAVAWGLLAAIGLGTVGGYVLARGSAARWSTPALALAEAWIAGMLFHVLIGHHRPAGVPAGSGARRGFLGGLAAAVLFVVATLGLRHAAAPGVGEPEASLAIDAALLAAVIAYVAFSRLAARPHRHVRAG